MRRFLESLVERFWRVSGRTLRPTGSGKLLLVLALAVGFAAMNTGNNLLFFGWGLVLSAIVISGILSESTLRAATPVPLPADEARARSRGTLPVMLENTRGVPAFGVAVSYVFGEGQQTERSGESFELRLSPGARRTTQVPWTPSHRGLLPISSLRVATAAPFGFFAKERVVDGERLPFGLRDVLVLPERIDTRALGRSLWARLGESPAGHAGNGDELFSLRPFKEGDDPRRIAWRRTAKTGRVVVRENEATRSRQLIVTLRVGGGASPDDVEDGVATAASLIEDLLDDGHAVGVSAPGVVIAPARSLRQRHACLRALALWSPTSTPTPPDAFAGAARIIIPVGAASTADADVVVTPLQRPSRVVAR